MVVEVTGGASRSRGCAVTIMGLLVIILGLGVAAVWYALDGPGVLTSQGPALIDDPVGTVLASFETSGTVSTVAKGSSARADAVFSDGQAASQGLLDALSRGEITSMQWGVASGGQGRSIHEVEVLAHSGARISTRAVFDSGTRGPRWTSWIAEGSAEASEQVMPQGETWELAAGAAQEAQYDSSGVAELMEQGATTWTAVSTARGFNTAQTVFRAMDGRELELTTIRVPGGNGDSWVLARVVTYR